MSQSLPLILKSINYFKLLMNSRSEHDITSEILTLKKKIYVQSSELEFFLQYLDQSVFKRGFSFCGPEKVQETPQFMRAFNTFTNLEKADYYFCCLKIIQELMKKQEMASTVCEEKCKFDIMFRMNAAKQWISSAIILNSEEKTVYFQSLDKTIRLQNYLIRFSKCKDRNAFVLQSCTSKGMIDTIRISHGNYMIFQDLQTKIKNQIVDCLKQKLSNLMQSKKRPKDMVMKSMLKSRQSISVEISKSSQRKSLRELVQQSTANLNFTIQDYRAISSTLIDHNTISNMDNFSDYEQTSKDVFINIEKNRVRKMYYFNAEEFNKGWIITQLSRYENFKVWKSSLFMISLLASIPAEKTQIFHEINMYKDGTECDYVYLRHFFTQGERSYYIDRSISTVEYGSYETSNSRGHIQYCIWRITESAKNANIQVMVECEISHIHSEDIYDVISEQIGDFDKITLFHPTKVREMMDNSMTFNNNELQAISFDDNRQFTSYEGVSAKPQQDRQSEFFSIYTSENKLEEGCEGTQIWQFEEQPVQRQSISKKYRYKLTPEDTVVKEYKLMKNNRFFDDSECRVNEYGDLVFVNEEKIKAQSSVLKSVLKKIGANIFTGKSILNVSLPIQIFSADTNLERLCKGIAYAPLFFQHKTVASPVEKMKAVIAFSIGNALLYIEMAKPFNPILGETYQGFIDGCPIYGEQIAHHPPISSLLMIGRGYFIHANLEAKVEFGLNNASGINQGLYKVAFHESNPNQNIISFFSPPGQLSGVVLGQRKLTLKNKTRYFDEKNQIFCEINWGKNKSHKDGNYTDFMEGKIVRLHKYQEDIYKVKVGKEDEVLGEISGRWTQSIKFDSEVIFDVNGIAPFKVTEEVKPLESDGKYRRDRMLVGARKLEEAQIAKEELEELQRADRKLRKEKGK